MEYYGEVYDVDERDLDKLSNMDTTDWDRELKEIGVEM